MLIIEDSLTPFLGKLHGEFLEKLKNNLYPLVREMLNDCLYQEPTVPLLTGDLIGSGSAFINDVLVAISSPVGQNSQPLLDFPDGASEEYINISIIFNQVYARMQHENVGATFTTPGSGAKFVEEKLNINADKYFSMLYEAFEKTLEQI